MLPNSHVFVMQEFPLPAKRPPKGRLLGCRGLFIVQACIFRGVCWCSS